MTSFGAKQNCTKPSVPQHTALVSSFAQLCWAHLHRYSNTSPVTLSRNYDRWSEQLFSSVEQLRWIALGLFPPTFLLNGLFTVSIKMKLVRQEPVKGKKGRWMDQ